MARLKYDWLKISKDYVFGIQVKDIETQETKLVFPTYEELCEKYGCNMNTLKPRAMEEKWGYQKQQYLRKLQIKNSEVNVNDLLGESTKFDALHLNNLEKVQTLINNFLKPYMEMLELDEIDLETYPDIKPLTPRDLKDISTIIKDSHSTVRSILGEQTTTQNLLEDIKDELIQQRTKKGISRDRLKKTLKQLEEADKIKSELEIRKKELERKLAEKNKQSQNNNEIA